MMKALHTSVAVVVAAVFLTVTGGHAMVRDSVTLNIKGQKRVLRLASGDAHTTSGMQSGGNSTGVSLVGHFRLELVRPDGRIVGKLDLGELAFDHGDGWNRRKALLLGDYNGDGNKWEVAFEGTGSMGIGAGRSIAGFDGRTGKLVRYRFRTSGGSIEKDVIASRYPSAVAFVKSYLRVRSYTNAAEQPPYGWIAELYSFDRKTGVFRLVRTVQDQKPQPWPSWPKM